MAKIETKKEIKKETSMEIKKIDPMAAGKVVGLISIISGLLEAVAENVANMTGTGNYAMGPLAIVLYPIIYAITGFISGYVGSWVYNIIAAKVGGIKFEI